MFDGSYNEGQRDGFADYNEGFPYNPDMYAPMSDVLRRAYQRGYEDAWQERYEEEASTSRVIAFLMAP